MSKSKPVVMAIFGGSGNLTQVKLWPSIYKLATRGRLPKDFHIFGIAADDLDTKSYQQKMREDILARLSDVDHVILDRLLSNMHYIKADLSKQDGYQKLEDAMVALEGVYGEPVLRLFYLAVPPWLFKQVIPRLVHDKDAGRYRIVIEKPFGTDRKNAQRLGKVLSKEFNDNQVWLVDHYLGKEQILNLLTFKLKNPILAAWNNRSVASVHISTREPMGLDGRLSFYDKAGAIRDMMQSHMAQMVAMVCLNLVPDDLKNVPRKKVDVLKAIRPFRGKVRMVTGQYRGYRKEVISVNPDSLTETYASLVLEVNNGLWKGVPIFIETGKKLSGKETSVCVTFKATPGEPANRLYYRLDPHPTIITDLCVVDPKEVDGSSASVRQTYCRHASFDERPIGDYERMILAFIVGDHSGALTLKETILGWKMVEPFLALAENNRPGIYDCGIDRPHLSTTLALSLGVPWPNYSVECPLCRN